MFFNELIFLTQCTTIGLLVLGAIRLGKEALVVAVCIFSLLGNLFVLKQTSLFSLTVTGADAFIIGAILCLNALQEFWGKEIAKTAIYINTACLVVYALFSYIHLLYVPAACDITQEHFSAILCAAPRITFASLVVHFFVQFFDYYFYGFLKRRTGKNRFLIPRNYISLAVSQGIDTVFFSFLGLYGLVENIYHIMLMSYLIKLGAIFFITPFILYVTARMRNVHEQL